MRSERPLSTAKYRIRPLGERMMSHVDTSRRITEDDSVMLMQKALPNHTDINYVECLATSKNSNARNERRAGFGTIQPNKLHDSVKDSGTFE